MEITFENFFIATKGDFKQINTCGIPSRDADYVSHGKNGAYHSKYWYETLAIDGVPTKVVIRLSSHWGNCAMCYWTLDGERKFDRTFTAGMIPLVHLRVNDNALIKLGGKLAILPPELYAIVMEVKNKTELRFKKS